MPFRRLDDPRTMMQPSAQERRDVDVLVADLERLRWRSSIDGRRSRPRSPALFGARCRARGRWSKPVPITVTLTSSACCSSMTAPKMMLASRSAAVWIDLGRLVDLEQAEVAPAGDVEQDAGRAVDGLLEQRRGDRGLRGVGAAALAGAGADAHHRGAGVGHDRAHVGEVEVDQAGDRDQVGDPLDALAQDVVGLA